MDNSNKFSEDDSMQDIQDIMDAIEYAESLPDGWDEAEQMLRDLEEKSLYTKTE